MEKIIIAGQALVIMGLVVWVLVDARTTRRQQAEKKAETERRIANLLDAIAARDDAINDLLRG